VNAEQTKQWAPLLEMINSGDATIGAISAQVNYPPVPAYGSGDRMLDMESMARLVDVRDGKVDLMNLSADAIDYANTKLNVTKAWVETAKQLEDMQGLNELANLTAYGQRYKTANLIQTGTTRKVNFGYADGGLVESIQAGSEMYGNVDAANTVLSGAKASTETGGFFSSMFSGVKGLFGKATSALSGGLNVVQKITKPVTKFLQSSAGKLLGPVLSIVSSVSDVMTKISSAKEVVASGGTVDATTLGLDILQAGAYPIANGLLNFIPGVGSIISASDALLNMFGFSPVKWLTDNLITLLPDSLFDSVGEWALDTGNNQQTTTPAGVTVQPPPASTVTVQANDFMIEPNANDKIGGVLDNKSVDEMVNLLRQMVGLLGQRQTVSLSNQTAMDIVKVATADR
ncbi:MAG: hypothetical protein EBU96_11810, partial [Actinobacteria bacterium]|nr:hypothetical protein [Actinomycetota bacterium]